MAAVVGTFAAVVAWVVARDLFVLTEARWFINESPPIDWLRFFIQPYLEWGNGRLAGIATFQLTGSVCGVDAPCINAVGAVLAGLAASLLVAHGYQLSRSAALSAAAAAAWALSPPLLAVLLWQAARFDLLALLGAIALSSLWWWFLGRNEVGWRAVAAFELVTLGLLAFTLNAKESAFYLLGVLPLIALVRGAAPRRVARNMLLGALPLGYAALFVGWALTHVAPDYASYAAGKPFMQGVAAQVSQALGVSSLMIYVGQQGPLLEALRVSARLIHALFAAGVLALTTTALIGGRRAIAPGGGRLRAASWRAALDELGGEIYLGAAAALIVFAGARSEGAAAHYMVIPYWAACMLLLLAARRAAALGGRWRLAVAGLLVLAITGTTAAYASQYVDRSAYRQIATASAQVQRLGRTLGELLDGRPVAVVHWRSVETPGSAFFILRSGATPDVGPDLWPFLVRDRAARPIVAPLTEGSAAELLARAGDFAGAAEVLVVIDREYRLLLLLHAGQPLHVDAAIGGR